MSLLYRSNRQRNVGVWSRGAESALERNEGCSGWQRTERQANCPERGQVSIPHTWVSIPQVLKSQILLWYRYLASWYWYHDRKNNILRKFWADFEPINGANDQIPNQGLLRLFLVYSSPNFNIKTPLSYHKLNTNEKHRITSRFDPYSRTRNLRKIKRVINT